MPTISIIVPVYNVSKYVQRCINSILEQTFMNFELILINDGSTDNSGYICDENAIKDNRIKVIHKKNGGLSDARNAGLDIAKGKYIGFVDSDDYIEIDMYEKLYDACLKHKSQISMCGRYNVYEDKKKILFSFIGNKIWSSKEAIENLLTWDNIDSSACDKLFEKEIFEDIRFPLGKYNEDIFVMSEILNKAKTIVHIGEPKYYYCHRMDSITTEQFTEKKMDLLGASQKILDFVEEKYPDLKPKAESFYQKGIIFLLSLLQTKEMRILYKNYYNKLKKLLMENFVSILLSNYLDRREKIKVILMVSNMYHFGRVLKRIIKLEV